MEPILTSKPFGVWATSGRGRQHEGPGHGRGLRAAVVALGGLICLWALVWEALPFPCFRGGLLAFGVGVVALVVWREVLWRRQTGDLANDLCDTVDALMEERLSRRTDL